ncbi:MAG: chromosomal replication initiator protein DnaA [Candidatus Pacebacteria bacterium]|nr:chromosomal replication initiator protein DnaA [Candidatus Paceibacterota bacterium]
MTTITDTKNLWETSLAEIETLVSKANFATWFKETFLIKINEGEAVIGVPNTFVKDWLSNKFSKTILKSLRDQNDEIKAVTFTVANIDKIRAQKEKFTRKDQKETQELPLADYYINKDDNLNPRYTFDSFIIGSFNELAHAASQAIVRQPGIVYNPLFIYGSTGHGKTHLIQAIGNKIKEIQRDKKVFYLTSEKFASEYVAAIQQNKMTTFKDKYRKYDVLIMDDIQFLSKMEKTQEELFHLFNTLYDNNKQIVFSSDMHPNFIPGLEERLKSRFNQGMIVDIPKPDSESRVAILQTKARQNNVCISNDVCDFLSTTIDGNIRELEGVINSIACQSQLKNRELTLNDVKDLVKNSARPKKMVSIKDLIKLVADFYNIDPDAICDKTRKKEVVRPRQITMYILREDFSTSYPTIGDKLGGRDHTTVIHSCEKIKNDLKTDQNLVQQISQIRAML